MVHQQIIQSRLYINFNRNSQDYAIFVKILIAGLIAAMQQVLENAALQDDLKRLGQATRHVLPPITLLFIALLIILLYIILVLPAGRIPQRAPRHPADIRAQTGDRD